MCSWTRGRRFATGKFALPSCGRRIAMVCPGRMTFGTVMNEMNGENHLTSCDPNQAGFEQRRTRSIRSSARDTKEK